MNLTDIDGLVLFFDTETTGLPDDRLPYEHPSQPHIVQLAWCLARPGGGISSEGGFIIDAGVPVPNAAAKVHGITTERAKAEGIAARSALHIFCALAKKAVAVCCHNVEFDLLMIDIALHRCEQGRARDAIRAMPKICTMELSRDICKIPPTERMVAAGRTGFKSPTLFEAHKIIVGYEFEGAHDARYDVRACRSIFEQLRIIEQGAILAR